MLGFGGACAGRRPRRLAWLGAVTVAAACALAGPAGADTNHPSGRDRSEEPGGSGTQGRSPGDPAGDTNGGTDEPGGPGGVDRSDQDGNDGCGNDGDFEDDDRGRCLGRQQHGAGGPGGVTAPAGGPASRGRGGGTSSGPAPDASVAGSAEPAAAVTGSPAKVRASSVERLVAGPDLSPRVTPQVLDGGSERPRGSVVASAPAAGPVALARTGTGVLALVFVAAAIVVAGVALVGSARARRRLA